MRTQVYVGTSGPVARLLWFEVLLLHWLLWQSMWLGSGLIVVTVLKTEVCFFSLQQDLGMLFLL